VLHESCGSRARTPAGCAAELIAPRKPLSWHDRGEPAHPCVRSREHTRPTGHFSAAGLAAGFAIGPLALHREQPDDSQIVAGVASVKPAAPLWLMLGDVAIGRRGDGSLRRCS
jgi:hypothetical protein